MTEYIASSLHLFDVDFPPFDPKASTFGHGTPAGPLPHGRYVFQRGVPLKNRLHPTGFAGLSPFYRHALRCDTTQTRAVRSMSATRVKQLPNGAVGHKWATSGPRVGQEWATSGPRVGREWASGPSMRADAWDVHDAAAQLPLAHARSAATRARRLRLFADRLHFLLRRSLQREQRATCALGLLAHARHDAASRAHAHTRRSHARTAEQTLLHTRVLYAAHFVSAAHLVAYKQMTANNEKNGVGGKGIDEYEKSQKKEVCSRAQ